MIQRPDRKQLAFLWWDKKRRFYLFKMQQQGNSPETVAHYTELHHRQVTIAKKKLDLFIAGKAPKPKKFGRQKNSRWINLKNEAQNKRLRAAGIALASLPDAKNWKRKVREVARKIRKSEPYLSNADAKERAYAFVCKDMKPNANTEPQDATSQ